MTIEELIELVHLLLMCGIMDKSALESGNLTNEEWLQMKGLIDKYQSEKSDSETEPKSSDLISREALKKHITEVFETEEEIDKKWAMGLKYSLKIIDLAPAVDAESVKSELNPTVTCWHDFDRGYEKGYEKAKKELERPQGEWKVNNYGEHICPICGHYALYDECQDNDYYEAQSNFCPECGADLRGKQND